MGATTSLDIIITRNRGMRRFNLAACSEPEIGSREKAVSSKSTVTFRVLADVDRLRRRGGCEHRIPVSLQNRLNKFQQEGFVLRDKNGPYNGLRHSGSPLQRLSAVSDPVGATRCPSKLAGNCTGRLQS